MTLDDPFNRQPGHLYFGKKYYGMPLCKVPTNYLNWIIKNIDMDKYKASWYEDVKMELRSRYD